jgi:transcriptional regulator with XRE-family HTH domain
MGSHPTPNQMVAYNLRRARQLLGWTQEETAEKLEIYLGERWSKATLSAAERSVAHPERVRQFSADELVAFAATFELPVSFFLEPAPPQTTVAVPGGRTIDTPLLGLLEEEGAKRVAELQQARESEWNA